MTAPSAVSLLMESVELMQRWLQSHITRQNAEATLDTKKACYYCGVEMPRFVLYWEVDEKAHEEDCPIRQTIELLAKIAGDEEEE